MAPKQKSIPFASRLLEREGGEIRLLTAKEQGRAAWFVLQLDAASYAHYKTALRSGSMDIRDYGTIVLSGWGELPAGIIEQYGGEAAL